MPKVAKIFDGGKYGSNVCLNKLSKIIYKLSTN